MKKKYRILVVDDNPNNLFLVRELLSRVPKVEICEASSGENALLQCVSEDIHLILLDVQMPVMDGYETAKMLQMTERTRNIPVIFLTAVFKAEEFIHRGYEVGAVDYLTKPLDDNILLNRIRHYQHLHERELKLTETLMELRGTRENLIQVEKLSALNSMVVGVSHQLNTPLGNAKMAATTLHDRIMEARKQLSEGQMRRSQIETFFQEGEEISELIHRALDRSIELISSFKQVAIDQTTAQREVFDLATLVEDTTSKLLENFRHQPWQVDVDIMDGITMDSFPQPLEHIIVNLLQNSIRHGFYGRDHGKIAITANFEEAGDIPKNRVLLSVSDNGVGITPDHLNKIFDPFFTTRLGHGGSGIGLSVCHRITTALLGGQVEVESHVGTGTTFKLSLPLRAPAII